MFRTRLAKLVAVVSLLIMASLPLALPAFAVAPKTSNVWCSKGTAIKLCYQINGHDQWVDNFLFATIGNYTGVSPAVISYEVTGPGGQVFPPRPNNPGTVSLYNGSTTSRTIIVSANLPVGEYCASIWTDWGIFVGKCWAVE